MSPGDESYWRKKRWKKVEKVTREEKNLLHFAIKQANIPRCLKNALKTRGGDTPSWTGVKGTRKRRKKTAAGAQTGTLTKRGGFSHSGTERANREAASQRRARSEKHMRLEEHTYTHTRPRSIECIYHIENKRGGERSVGGLSCFH